MKKKILVLILVLLAGVALFTLTGCQQNGNNTANNTVNTTGDDKTPVSNIELGKKQYIEQLKKVQINGSEDYIMITEQRKWEVPEHEAGTTVSFAISIPYTIHVDGKDYSSECIIGSSNIKPGEDGNPKYKVEVTNLTKNYETQVIISKK